MSYSAPLELLTDISGSITFGWVDDGVYYARFTRSLSARVGTAFAERLREAVRGGNVIKYFGDGRGLESYDLLARSAFVRVVNEHRRNFEQINLLAWQDGDLSPAYLSALGSAVAVAADEFEFEARLTAVAPRARVKLGAGTEPRQRSRWSLRR